MAGGGTLKAGKAVISLSLSGNEAIQKSLRSIEGRMKNFGRAMSAIGDSALRIGGIFSAGFGVAIKAASDAQETMSKFSTVFGASSGKSSSSIAPSLVCMIAPATRATLPTIRCGRASEQHRWRPRRNG